MTETPKVLYHYTTAQGLLGILKTNSLWASDLNFMNDFSEMKYSSNLLASQLRSALEPFTASESKHVLSDLIASNFNTLVSLFSTFACCFCEEADQLSQWRAYSDKGTGYSIGFDAKTLRENAGKGQLVKVIYDPQKQIDLIVPKIHEFVKTAKAYGDAHSSKDLTSESPEVRQMISHFILGIFEYLFSFKDPAFSEEIEWRLVSKHYEHEIGDFQFREIKGTVVPYAEIKFPPSDSGGKSLLPIFEIVQGPLIDPALGEKSLGLLLAKYGYENAIVRRSKVPIRF